MTQSIFISLMLIGSAGALVWIEEKSFRLAALLAATLGLFLFTQNFSDARDWLKIPTAPNLSPQWSVDGWRMDWPRWNKEYQDGCADANPVDLLSFWLVRWGVLEIFGGAIVAFASEYKGPSEKRRRLQFFATWLGWIIFWELYYFVSYYGFHRSGFNPLFELFH